MKINSDQFVHVILTYEFPEYFFISICTQTLSGFGFDMRLPCISKSAFLCIIMQFMFAGCTERPIPTVEPFDEHRPTTHHPRSRFTESLTVIDDRTDVDSTGSQFLGFGSVIVASGNAIQLADGLFPAWSKHTSGPRVMYSVIPSSHTSRNQGSTEWVREVIRPMVAGPPHAFVLYTEHLSMPNLRLILSALEKSRSTVSLFVPLGLLAYTYQSIVEFRHIVDHYFYHISGFWIPSSSAFQGSLNQNPFSTNGHCLLNFLTGETSIGSPIPRKDLDLFANQDLGEHITIMMSPIHDSFDCIVPNTKTNCTNIKRVSEFGALSRNQLVDFITAFKNKYKFINGFGLSSYSSIPTSWVSPEQHHRLRVATPCCG